MIIPSNIWKNVFREAETLVWNCKAATEVKISFQNSTCGYHPDNEHREVKQFSKITEQ